MRTVRSLEKLPDSDGVVKFAELLRNTLRGPKVRVLCSIRRPLACASLALIALSANPDVARSRRVLA